MALPSAILLLLLPLAALGQAPPPPPMPPPEQSRLVSTADFNALYALRASLSIRARDWPRRADPCTLWRGVDCRSGRVVSLHLSPLRRTRRGREDPRFALDDLGGLALLESFNSSGFLLPGFLSDSLVSSFPPLLSSLDMSFSSLFGPIPSGLAQKRRLSVLILSGNLLNGTIPQALAGLMSLKVLDLSGNNLTGPFPSWLASLPNLTSLSLSFNSFRGNLPPGFGNLRSLKSLRLSSTGIIGIVPSQLGSLSMLVELDLSLNSLSGMIPKELNGMESLQVLDLSRNNLSGELPASVFLGMARLKQVDLQWNQFNSGLPDSLWLLRELVYLDVSSNKLTGELPGAFSIANASGAVFNLSNNLYFGDLPSSTGKLLGRLKVLDISGNYFQGEVPLSEKSSVVFGRNCFGSETGQRSVDECTKFYVDRGKIYRRSDVREENMPAPQSSRRSQRKLIYILVGVFGGMIALAILVSVLVLCLRKSPPVAAPQRETTSGGIITKMGRPSSSSIGNLPAVGDTFTYTQLLQATSNFSDENLIKHGHSGDLFHGTLESGASVVVKRIDVNSFRNESWVAELDLFSHASHMRLVPFLGHCLENENDKLLAYKYMPNGDLSNALYQKNGNGGDMMKSLDWITRLKIATGVAEALCYLHHEHAPALVHRDIQASSVLLDDKFEVRLGSLSNVCPQGDKQNNVLSRFLRSSQSTEPSTSGSTTATCTYDVYCFGLLLLELVTGKLGLSGWHDISYTNQCLEEIMPFINMYDKELVMKIVDPSLILDEDFVEEVWAVAIVAKSCLKPKPSKRPLMKFVLKALESPLRVVRDESLSGSARLRAASSRGSWNAAIFGSWRSSSDAVSVSGRRREASAIRRIGAVDSQRSAGDRSFSNRRQSNEIFPEPAGTLQEVELEMKLP